MIGPSSSERSLGSGVNPLTARNTKADVMQITWRMDNSGVRECGRSSVWLRLPHLPFLRRGCSASSASEWEDRQKIGTWATAGWTHTPFERLVLAYNG